MKDKEIEELEKRLEQGPLFLDKKESVKKIVYSSYLRSGNTFMRAKLEAITGITTGSTVPNAWSVNFQLLASGLRGEGHIGDDVWFVKTHFPLVSPAVGCVSAHKALIGVRNPIDVLVSYFEFKMTFT